MLLYVGCSVSTMTDNPDSASHGGSTDSKQAAVTESVQTDQRPTSPEHNHSHTADPEKEQAESSDGQSNDFTPTRRRFLAATTAIGLGGALSTTATERVAAIDGQSIQTEPTAPPRKRARRAGLTIHTTKTVTSMAEIDGADNTLYIVDGNNGPLEHPDAIHRLGDVHDVAICGKNGAKLKIPANFRKYSLTTSGGNGFMWSGIDFDQTAPSASARINFNIDDRGFYEYFKTIGKGRWEDAPTDACPNYPEPGDKAGPRLHIPALSENGTVRLKNVSFIYGGVMATHDHCGNRPSGIQFSAGKEDGRYVSKHKGTLDLVNVQLEGFPNNAIYASAASGTVNATNCRFWNNGVSQIRIPQGTIEDCDIGYDYNDNIMKGAKAPGHGLCGIGIEQKKAGKGSPPPTIKGCSIHMENVAKGGQGIKTYTAAEAGNHIEAILGCDIHIDNTNTAMDYPPAADIIIGDPESSCGKIKNCTFSGSASGGTSIKNAGPTIDVCNNTFSYPAGRKKKEGSFNKIDCGDGGDAPEIAVSPKIKFGNVSVGQTKSKTATATNKGDAPLDITGVRLTGQNENAYNAGGFPSKIAPGETADATVEFAPTSTGQKNAALEIDSNDTDDNEQTVSIPLSGTGVRQQHTLVIKGTGEYAVYSFSASGGVTLKEDDSEDTIKNSTAFGAVDPDSDTYTFEGTLEEFFLDGNAKVTVDGEPINPKNYPSSLSAVKFKGTGSYASYKFTVSGAVEDTMGQDREDSITGGDHVEGAVSAGQDVYIYTGTLEGLATTGDVKVVKGDVVSISSNDVDTTNEKTVEEETV